MIKNYIWHLLSVNSPLNSGAAIAAKAFMMLCLYGVSDIATGFFGKDLVVSGTIYGVFTSIVFAGFFKESYDNKNGVKPEQND